MKKAWGCCLLGHAGLVKPTARSGPECLSWSRFNSSPALSQGGPRPRPSQGPALPPLPRLPDPPGSTCTPGSATVGAARGKGCLSVHQGVLVRVSRSLPPISRKGISGRGSLRGRPGARPGTCPGAAAVCGEHNLPVAPSPLLLPSAVHLRVGLPCWDPPSLTRQTPQATEAGRGGATVGLWGHSCPPPLTPCPHHLWTPPFIVLGAESTSLTV